MASGTTATLSPTSSTPATLNYCAAERLPLQKARSTLFLDGMRGLAALYVLMRHVTWVPMPDSSGVAWRRIVGVIEHIFRYGHMAVIFFFVLSGFVIHLRYAKQLQSDPMGAKFGWGEFVFRRVRRLYPPLLAAILVTSVFDYACGVMGFHHFYAMRGQDFDFLPVAIKYNHELPTLVGNLSFLMQMHVPVWGTDSPLWSLAYEWWFYMLYPLLWQLSRRSVLLATGCVAAGFLLTRLPGNWPGIQDQAFSFFNWHAFAAPHRVLGLSIAHWPGPSWRMLSTPRRVLGALPAWWCGVLLADVYSGRIRVSFKWLAPLIVALGFMFVKGAPEVVKALVAGIGFSGMIALGFYLQERNVRLTVLNRLKFFGDLSYSLYVTHWPVVIFLTPLWALHVAGRFPGSLPLGLVMISVAPVVFAYLIHLVAEKPFTGNRKAKTAG